MKENRLTSKQAASLLGIPESTLRCWRMRRYFDERYPRFHKMFTGRVFYIREELTEDYAKMEMEIKRNAI